MRDGERTVLTMANDFSGDPREFAVVIPVPTFIQRDQIAVVSKGLLDHLDVLGAAVVRTSYEDTCRARSRRSAGTEFPAAAPLGSRRGAASTWGAVTVARTTS